MLTDLEERHSYYRNQDQVVFGDLTPIADTGFSRARIPYNFLLMCFFLIAIAVAFYSYTVNESAGQYYPDSALSTAAVTESIAREATALASDMPLPVAHQLAGLKLDLAVPQVSSPPSLQLAVIQSIDISERNGVTNILLHLDHSAEFRVYSLQDPDRVVLEIDHAQLQATIPAMPDHPYIERFRFSNQNGEIFRLVADAVQPVLINNAEMTTSADGNSLSISLSPAARTDKIELIPAMTTVATVEEASFGQMDIRPSTSTPAMLMGRLLAEAKTLYSRRDFRQADEKVQGILKQQPLHIEARLLYTSALISRDNMASAMQVLAEGLQLNPGISEWAKVYAKLLVDQGQTVQAVEVLTYGLPQISQDQDYYAFYAALLQGLARHDEAAEFYRALLGQQPENRLWWMGLGISLDALNNSDDAVYAYSRALEGDTLNNELRQYVLEQTERLRR
jgi:Flp pilus assembly protein TadD